MSKTVVYTDGACSGNPGPGGWAWAVPEGPFGSGAAARTTNQRMELEAVLDAVKTLDGPLHVVSDSTYVVNCFRDRWWEGWIRRGWTNSQKKPVANRDLWEPLVTEVRSRDISFEWVKGHSGDTWNDVVDRLAVEAATTQRGRRGDRPPETLGVADEPKPASPVESNEIPGHTLVVFGHRPPELGGYDDNPIQRAVRARLRDVIAAKLLMHEDLVVLSGLSLGTEMLAAEAAALAGAPYVAVLAHPGLDHPWPEATRRRFNHLVDGAREVRTLQNKPPANRQQAAASLARRDAWLRRNAGEAIVVWDGADDHVGRSYRSMVDAIGEEHVWRIDPAELSTG